jgi:acetyl/propionyl-CoA carboxylase alpha subunit
MKPRVRINGVVVDPAVSADIVEVEPGVYSALVDGNSYELAITGDEIEVRGTLLIVERDDPRRWNPATSSRRAEGREALKAPMPGKVIRILVSEGQEIAAGQGLIVVEAMKMQNEMKAPRAGRVAAITVREQEAVTAGQILIAIE